MCFDVGSPRFSPDPAIIARMFETNREVSQHSSMTKQCGHRGDYDAGLSDRDSLGPYSATADRDDHPQTPFQKALVEP